MEPIINPWIIYAVNTLDTLNRVSGIIALFSFFIAFIAGLAYFQVYLEEDTEDDCTKVNNGFKIFLIIFIVFGLMKIFIPDKNTLLSMLTVSFITPDNINIAEDHIVELVTQIMDTVSNSKK